jgi:hypothetical protein
LKTFKHNFGGNTVSAPEPWIDTTEDVEGEDAPFTLAQKDIGVGALQFSIALYRGGEESNIDIARLQEMLADFADNKQLGKGFDEQVYKNRVDVVGASYHVGNDLVRVWYCSDERNVAFVTYVCDWEKRNSEANECEAIVKSIEFTEETIQGKGDRL